MILYHSISTYQLLNHIVHKILINPNKKAVLLIADVLARKLSDVTILKNIFDEVIEFSVALPIVQGKTLKENLDLQFNNLLSNENKIQNFTEIHVGAAHYYFGLYLAMNYIPFVFWEDAAGILTNYDILINIEKDKYIVKQRENLKYGLYDGTCESITKIMCNFDAQGKKFNNGKAEHFDVVKKIGQLSYNNRNFIKTFFVKKKCIDINKNCTLFLTQHFVNLKLLEFEDHILIYQLVFDYFQFNKNINIKAHPDDIMYYSQLFPNAKIIRENFPSELIPYIFKNKPKEIATISSTAINNLYSYFDNTFTLNNDFEKQFKFIHKNYFVMKIIEILQKENITFVGTNIQTYKCLCDHSDLKVTDKIFDMTFKKNNSLVVDDLLEEELSRDDIIEIMESLAENEFIIFPNTKKDFCFYNINKKYLWDNIVPICIKKKSLDIEEFYSDLETDIIYFYSKNKETLRMISNLKMEKVLKNTGIELNIEPMTDEQKQIKVLEGILEATENRLLYYIDLVNNNQNT